LDGGPFKYSSQFYYARYRDQSKTAAWAGDESSVKGCINPDQSFEEVTQECTPPNKLVAYRKVDTGQATTYTIHLRDETSLDFSAADVQAKACEVLNNNLDRPRLRPEKIKLGSYTDPFTLPQTTTECTNTYDTGVPDVGSSGLVKARAVSDIACVPKIRKVHVFVVLSAEVDARASLLSVIADGTRDCRLRLVVDNTSPTVATNEE